MELPVVLHADAICNSMLLPYCERVGNKASKLHYCDGIIDDAQLRICATCTGLLNNHPGQIGVMIYDRECFHELQ